MFNMTNEMIIKFKTYLVNDEKSSATIEKYIRDISAFKKWLMEKELCKTVVLAYKEKLIGVYAPRSVNSIISSLNAFFNFISRQDCCVKTLKIQRQIFASKEKELTKPEYERLLSAAVNKKNERLYYLMQTICSTGIRVSELKFITVSAVFAGKAIINCKGKTRTVFLSTKLCGILKKYIKRNKISDGCVFVTKNGRPLDRSNIWSDMKKLCEDAGVSKEKVFPHNLRHLFARTYYNLEKDIVRLADILGHSSIETTRIYTLECGEIHRMQIEKMHLLRC